MKKSPSFFSEELEEKLFYISCKEWEQPTSTINCWLVVGKERALLVDAGIQCCGLRKYAEKLAEGRPVILALSHGHFDHIGAISEFKEVYMHPADKALLNDTTNLERIEQELDIKPLYPGKNIELGDRKLEIFGVEGHTKGSLLFLDSHTKVLISGDSVARRGLFLNPEKLPISKYFDDLLKIEKLNFSQIASAHDRFLLPKSQISYFIKTFINEVENPDRSWLFPDGKEMFSIHAGSDIADLKYLSCSFPKEYWKQIKKELYEWKKEHTVWWNQ